MLGLVLIYFIGKTFYDLAAEFNKSKWGYAILGVALYYLGTFIGGLVIASYFIYTVSDSNMEDLNSMSLAIIAIIFGIISCTIGYRILKWHIKKEDRISDSELLDDDFLERFD